MSKRATNSRANEQATLLDNRERWLGEAVLPLSSIVASNGGKEHKTPLVSFGFPSVRGLSKSKRRIGECWSAKATTSGQPTILISPLLSDPVEILGVLLHELIHASGIHGHRKDFSQLARKCGLEGKPTATYPGAALAAELATLAKQLGPLPHASLNPIDSVRPERKQTTRMRLYECDVCGQKIRAATDELTAYHVLSVTNGEVCGVFVLQTK